MGKLRIVSNSGRSFTDRREAGRLLGEVLAYLRGQRPVVLGIPRGGVIVARDLAAALDADLDIVLSRKLRTPGHLELAMGSVAEDGNVFLNNDVVQQLSISDAQIQQERAIQMHEIARRVEMFRSVLPRTSLRDRLVIVTDDGVATGATTQAALWSVRLEKPRKLIAAIPVGAQESLERLSRDVDEEICLRAPPYFAAVGQFYVNFDQVDDEDVLKVIQAEAQRRNRMKVETR